MIQAKNAKRGIPGDNELQCAYEVLLNPIKSMFNQKSVLDLGCFTGYSTNLIKKKYGAKSCTGVDLVPEFIDLAAERYSSDTVKFIAGSMNDYTLMADLVKDAEIITSFGNFYHLYNHFDLIKLFCQPHVEFLVLDTLYGSETSNPSMVWTWQQVINSKNSILKGTPNISWIKQACECFGFKLDYVHRYYTQTNFKELIEQQVDLEANKRMTLRFFNSKLIKKNTYFDIDEIWQWSNQQLIQKI
jgi:ubiquinone/menaquinone biosynthesis C-methylase UbiE